MKDIVVLAPIKDIYDKTNEIIKENKYSTVQAVMGNMGEGLKVAKKLEADGAKIIVTRGGTYKLVHDALKIPVVEIKVSAYDIIESFDKLHNTGEKIGLVGYSNVVYGFDILKKFIPNEVVKIELKKEEDIYEVIEKNKNLGINTFIGDSNIKRIVEELNCKGIVINSQKESIHTAIQEARRINKATKDENFKAKQITAMADFVHDGLIAVDNDENITVFNKTAEKLFGISHKDAINKNINEIIPDSKFNNVLKTSESQVGEILNYKDAKFSSNITPIIIDENIAGAVSTFQEVDELQSIEQKIRISLNTKGFVAKYKFADIIYKSDEIKDCIEIAKEYAKYDAPIHICGESGVGKELFCQSIHNYSSRKHGPFVAINCAAIPPTLIESELFGFEEGSFTGAKKKGKPGVFELAHNGTLLLDEVNEIPRELQGRLLRVLQEKQIMRVGGQKIIPIDVKIISTSNKYLKKMVETDKFRKDLYFRLNVLNLRIPSLSKRKDDILILAEHFIDKYSYVYNKEPLKITPEVKKYFLGREYEGNVRELENIIERNVILSSFDFMKNNDAKKENKDILTESTMLDKSLKDLECSYIKMIYHKTGMNVNKTCDILKINRTTLWRKLKDINE